MGGKYVVHNKNLLYPELSFKINGILFEVFKQLGGGHKEIYYQKAIAKAFLQSGILFQEQYYVPLMFNGEIVGKYFLDFLIEDTIVLEIKRNQFISAHVIYQTKQYLDRLNKSLGLIACFTHKGVFIKRIIHQ